MNKNNPETTEDLMLRTLKETIENLDFMGVLKDDDGEEWEFVKNIRKVIAIASEKGNV